MLCLNAVCILHEERFLAKGLQFISYSHADISYSKLNYALILSQPKRNIDQSHVCHNVFVFQLDGVPVVRLKHLVNQRQKRNYST